jgi:alpha-maltose-1-phosphate synthase
MHYYYVCLSPTFGMHQYTAGLANEQAGRVTVLGPCSLPCDRFAPQVTVRAEVDVWRTGLHPTNFRLDRLHGVYQKIVAERPDVVHFTSPHLWNPLLLCALRRAGIPTVHTLHDLDPHSGTSCGRLRYAWHDLVVRWADHLLVHGQVYRNRLLARGVTADRITTAPLLHLFVSYENEQRLINSAFSTLREYSAIPFVLFFARLERYKGVDVLVEALRLIEQQIQPSTFILQPFKAIIAGQGDLTSLVRGLLPSNVEVRQRLIGDDEAIDLFQRCSVVVLPYRDATQSALIAAAYFFGKPVIVTRTGALPEYVIEGETGWIVPPADPAALAAALQQAMDDPERLINLGRAGRGWYEAHRVIERAALRQMYDRVVGARHASRP